MDMHFTSAVALPQHEGAQLAEQPTYRLIAG
jgi:hypothetical protein